MSHFVKGILEVKNINGFTENDSTSSQWHGAKWHSVLRLRPLFIHSSYLDALKEFKEKRTGIESDASHEVYSELEQDITLYKRDTAKVVKKSLLDKLKSKHTDFVNEIFMPVSYKFKDVKNFKNELSQGKLLHQIMSVLADFYGEQNVRITIWIGNQK